MEREDKKTPFAIDKGSESLRLANQHAIQMAEGTLDPTQSALDANRVRRGEMNVPSDNTLHTFSKLVRSAIEDIAA